MGRAALLFFAVVGGCGFQTTASDGATGGDLASLPGSDLATAVDLGLADLSATPGADLAGADLAAVAGDLAAADLAVSTCDGACAPVRLASELSYPQDIAVFGNYVYVTEWGDASNGLEGLVSRLDKQAGCPSADMGCLDRLATSRFRVASIAAGPTDVCWFEYYENMRDLVCLRYASGAIRTIANNEAYAEGLRLDGDRLLWVNWAVDGNVAQQSILATAATPVTVLASTRPTPTAVAFEPAGVYWTELGPPDAGGAVWAATRDGGAPRQLAARQGTPGSAQVYGGYVYWAAFDDGTVMRAPSDGTGAAQPIATGQARPLALAVDASGVYWLNLGLMPDASDGTLQRADLDGANRRTLVDPVVSAVTVVLDDQAAYVLALGLTYGSGYILRVAK
jgi:hypothetical protein